MSAPTRGIYRKRDGLTWSGVKSKNLSWAGLNELDANPSATRIAVDLMGGDGDPAALVSGVALAAAQTPNAEFLLLGDGPCVEAAASEHASLEGRVEIRHTDHVVTMEDKPSEALRRADGSSMAAALDCVANAEASAVVSSGNTGALMALAALRLGRIDGVSRPAIAVLWPSIEPEKQTVVLDVGADVRMEARNLAQFAAMGAVFARIGLGLDTPRVGLLNIGAEAHKGRATLHEASELIAASADAQGFAYVGFVEANDIPMNVIDVAVTDGFTGNVALKAAEGTAKLIRNRMKSSLTGSPLARLGALIASGALKEMNRSLDPRAGNGGIFLGLRGSVVKSHGAADALGFAAATALAIRIGAAGLPERMSERMIDTAPSA